MEIVKRILSSALARYVFIICFVTVSFLFAPKPHSPSEYCGTFFDLGKHAGFVINCDSYEYVRVSTNLSILMEQNSLRQSRPLFCVLGTIFGSLVYPVLRLFHFNIYQSFFAGYILLNFLLLLWSAYLFDTLLKRNTALNVIERSAFLVLLISNSVVKTFFWSADEQMFILLTPLLCIFFLDSVTRSNGIANWRIGVVSVLCGLSLLVYGNFIILAACIFIALICSKVKPHVILLNVALMCFPTIIWLITLRTKGVEYYNHEAAHYHQFIWVLESLSKSPSIFLTEAGHNFASFVLAFNSTSKVIIVIFISIAIFTHLLVTMRPSRILPRLCYTVFALSFTFFYLLGFYPDRLTLGVVVPCFLVIAYYYRVSIKFEVYVTTSFLIAFAICWHIYNASSFGPFS